MEFHEVGELLRLKAFEMKFCFRRHFFEREKQEEGKLKAPIVGTIEWRKQRLADALCGREFPYFGFEISRKAVSFKKD